jgi:hypothetical protein
MSGSKIRNEPAIQNILSRMPDKVADSFSDEQLINLKVAIGSRNWGKHKIDFRGTFPLPFFKSKIYYVFLMGRNYRDLTRQENLISSLTLVLFVSLFITFAVILGTLAMYLII